MTTAPEHEAVEPLFAAVRPKAESAVTPIGVQTPGGSVPLGTGTLFAIGDRRFLVTAAHVLVEAKRYGDGQLLGFAMGEQTPNGRKLLKVPLQGETVRMEGVPDVGVYRLSDDTAAELGQGKRFLTLDDVALRPARPGWAWVVGFPNEWYRPMPSGQSPAVKYNLFTFAGIAPVEVPSGLAEFEPQVNFVVNLDRGNLVERGNLPAPVPEYLKGISGCSVWQTVPMKAPLPADLDRIQVKVVGIQHGHYRNTQPTLLKASNWEAVAVAICRAYPDLVPSFQMRFDAFLNWRYGFEAKRAV